MATTLYKGFSFSGFKQRGRFALYDTELVKRDILNHVFTILGEHRMMPSFGTRIPLLTFEQADTETLNIVEEDLLKVINYDPRVQLINMNVFCLPNNNAIIGLIDLFYVEFKVTDTLRIEVPPQ